MRKIFAILTAGLVLAGAFYYRAYGGHPRNAADRGTFFRIKVALAYKDKPIDFNLVVGCGVRIGRPLAGGTSVETKAMTAFLYAKEIPDGHAVSIQTVPVADRGSPCFGDTTANGEMPANWLPPIVFFDRVEDLAHGEAYITKDAFDVPNAPLAFGGAVIEAATRADYDAFSAHETGNLIPSHLSDWMTHLGAPLYRKLEEIPPAVVAEPWRGWDHTSRLSCRAMRRWKLPSELRSRIEQAWPADRPKYWSPDKELSAILIDWIANRKRQLFRYNEHSPQASTAEKEEVFATDRDDGLSSLSSAAFADRFYHENTAIETSTAKPGRGFCDRESPPPLYEAVTGRKWTSANNTNIKCRIDGQIIDVEGDCTSTVFIQNTDYILKSLNAFGG